MTFVCLCIFATILSVSNQNLTFLIICYTFFKLLVYFPLFCTLNCIRYILGVRFQKNYELVSLKFEY